MKDELRELVQDLDRYYYYGKLDAFAEQMARIRKYMKDTKKPVNVTGDVI